MVSSTESPHTHGPPTTSDNALSPRIEGALNRFESAAIFIRRPELAAALSQTLSEQRTSLSSLPILLGHYHSQIHRLKYVKVS